jgi:hypothetical protein
MAFVIDNDIVKMVGELTSHDLLGPSGTGHMRIADRVLSPTSYQIGQGGNEPSSLSFSMASSIPDAQDNNSPSTVRATLAVV